MKVIFLDFNGILDTCVKPNVIDYDNLQRLKQIVIKTNAKIVISSSIKNQFLITGVYGKVLKSLLEVFVIEGIEVIGMTEMMENREFEITSYLLNHDDITDFVILEAKEELSTFKDKVVKLQNPNYSEYMGLDDYDVKKAISILNPPIEEIKLIKTPKIDKGCGLDDIS